MTHNFTPLRIYSRAESKNQFMPTLRIEDCFVTPFQGIVFDLNNLISFLINACTYGLQHIFSPVHVQYILTFGNQEIQTSFKLGQAKIIFRIKTNIALTSWDVTPSGNNPRIVTIFTLVLSCQVSRGGRGVTLL